MSSPNSKIAIAPDYIQPWLRWINGTGPPPPTAEYYSSLTALPVGEIPTEIRLSMFGYFLARVESPWSIPLKGGIPLWARDTIVQETWHEYTDFQLDTTFLWSPTTYDQLQKLATGRNLNPITITLPVEWCRSSSKDYPRLSRKKLSKVFKAYLALDCRDEILSLKINLFVEGWLDTLKITRRQSRRNAPGEIGDPIIQLIKSSWQILKQLAEGKITLLELVESLNISQIPQLIIDTYSNNGLNLDVVTAAEILAEWVSEKDVFSTPT